MSAMPENFFTLKGIIEKLFEILGIENARFERGGGAYLHPGQKAVVSIDGEVIGEMGCTHPRVEKNFGLSCNAYLAETISTTLRRTQTIHANTDLCPNSRSCA